MPSGSVTVPSVYAREYGFTVTGTNTLAYAERFANALDAALNNGTLAYSNLTDSADTIPGYTQSGPSTVTEQEISKVGSGAYTLPDTVSGTVYTFISTDGSVTVTGSGLGDDVLVEGEKQAAADSLTAVPSTTYIDVGGANLITFVDGNNVYDGSGADSFDTIVAGSGKDSISTGAVGAIVFSGTGSGDFTLNDTVVAGADSNAKSTVDADYNQFAILDDGTNTVSANGLADVVIATAPGQLIIGGASTADTDLVSLVAPTVMVLTNSADAPAAIDGNDTVVANAATFSVYDATDNNAIFGGSGALVAVFAANVSGSVVGGTGTTNVYADSGDTINYFSAATMTGGIVTLGAGSESVNASGANSILTVVLGTGNETLTSGANTTYNADVNATGAGTSITINDFSPTDTFNFVGYTDQQYQDALNSGETVSGGYQITLSDSTTVTFTNISSIAGHTTSSPS